jgi:hypothetical protein
MWAAQSIHLVGDADASSALGLIASSCYVCFESSLIASSASMLRNAR